MTVLVLTGSARHGSFTRQVGAALVDLVDDATLAPRLTQLPFFDQDLESQVPAAVDELRRLVDEADLLVVVTPEYNGTIPGLLGNAIDWLSRPYAQGVLTGKPVLALAASPGAVGGARALVALRTVLGNAGAELIGTGDVIPEVDRRLAEGQADDVLRAQLLTLVAEAREHLLLEAQRAA
jgi:chromate reductase